MASLHQHKMWGGRSQGDKPFVGDWPPQDAWRVMDLLPLARQAAVFGYLPPEFQVEMADAVARDRLARLVTEMNADERADLYNEMSEDQRTVN